MPKKKKNQTYKQMMADILKSKNKSNENTKIVDATGGGTPQKVVKI
jgi:hypothetical protein